MRKLIIFVILAFFSIDVFADNVVVTPFVKHRPPENGYGAYDDIDEVRKRPHIRQRFRNEHKRPNMVRKIDRLSKAKREKALNEIRRHRKAMRDILGDEAKNFNDNDFIAR